MKSRFSRFVFLNFALPPTSIKIMYLSLTPLTIVFLSTNFKPIQAYTRTIPGQTSCYRRCLQLNMLCDPVRNQCIPRNQPTRCTVRQTICIRLPKFGYFWRFSEYFSAKKSKISKSPNDQISEPDTNC